MPGLLFQVRPTLPCQVYPSMSGLPFHVRPTLPGRAYCSLPGLPLHSRPTLPSFSHHSKIYAVPRAPRVEGAALWGWGCPWTCWQSQTRSRYWVMNPMFSYTLWGINWRQLWKVYFIEADVLWKHMSFLSPSHDPIYSSLSKITAMPKVGNTDLIFSQNLPRYALMTCYYRRGDRG